MEYKFTIRKEYFEQNNKAVMIKDIGDEFNPLWGYDVISLTEEQIKSLLDGKIIETNCGGEYGILIGRRKCGRRCR